MARIKGITVPIKLELDEETGHTIEMLNDNLAMIEALEDLKKRVQKIEDFLQLDQKGD